MAIQSSASDSASDNYGLDHEYDVDNNSDDHESADVHSLWRRGQMLSSGHGILDPSKDVNTIKSQNLRLRDIRLQLHTLLAA